MRVSSLEQEILKSAHSAEFILSGLSGCLRVNIPQIVCVLFGAIIYRLARHCGHGRSSGDYRQENVIDFASRVLRPLILSVGITVVILVIYVLGVGEASIVPDSNEVKAVKQVIRRSYELRAKAARDFDVSEFSSVYIDDPAITLNKDQMDVIKKVFPNSNQQGMLVYMTAFYANWKLGAERLERLQAEAKANGRELSAEDLANSPDPVGPPRRGDPIYNDTLDFKDVQINKNRAEVIMDDGAALQRLILVKTNKGWRITDFEYLSVHF